jgi:hypothetical protein
LRNLLDAIDELQALLSRPNQRKKAPLLRKLKSW